MTNLTDFMKEDEARRFLCLNLACSERPLLDAPTSDVISKAVAFEAYLKGVQGG